MSESRSHRKLVRDALLNPNLQTALRRSARSYAAARRDVMQDFDFEAARAQVRAIKERCVSNMRALFERFKDEAEKVGAVVHEVKDGAEAAEIIARIARERGAKLLVKSKSMLTEEIDLNQRLSAYGLNVVETDLGERIIQLAGEKPSHFTMPAMHKTREQVAELFSRITGKPVSSDIPELVKIARQMLRQCFVEADIGLSGANIAIAESGTLVLVSNEGNARLVTTLPPVHIALVGYEKLVETLEDATSILKVLARSATGQKQTAYVSFITGPSRTTDIEKTLTLGVHGPTEVHIIFVDNGRMAMAADPELRQALYCIKCGACLNLCPVYNSVGGHAFSSGYMGGIGTVLSSYHGGLETVEDTLDLCSGCGTCTSVCPALVDIPEMILHLRRRITARQGATVYGRLGTILIKHRSVLQSTAKLVRTVQPIVLRQDRTLGDIPIFSGLLAGKRLPGLAEKFLCEMIPSTSNHSGNPRVALFAGCLTNFVYPEIGLAIVDVLTRLGAAVIYPKQQSCCGAPALYSGDFTTAQKLAADVVETFNNSSVDYVVTGCPSCAAMLKYRFPNLLRGTHKSEYATELSRKVVDFSQLAATLLADPSKLSRFSTGYSVAYHIPCHQKHTLNTVQFSLDLIDAAGLAGVGAIEPDECCGFAGTYAFKQPAISASILDRKIESVLASKADIVATDCPGCIMQIRGGLAARDSSVRVFHTAQLLAGQIE
jgi:L-lactate dehydrogenase complex protein LldF